MKKMIVPIISLLLTLGLWCLFMVLPLFGTFNDYIEIVTIENEHNKVIIKYKDDWSDIAHNVKILYGSNTLAFNKTSKEIITGIDNNNMSVRESNFKHEWIDKDTLIIHIRGDNSTGDSTQTINFNMQ